LFLGHGFGVQLICIITTDFLIVLFERIIVIDFNLVSLAIFDLDGTLTDGKYMVSNNGTVTKSFDTRDFFGMQKLQDAGISVLILTHCYDSVIDMKISQMPRKAKHKLYLKKVHWEVEKYDALEHWLIEHNDDFPGLIINKNVVFMGDSENDLTLAQKCAYSACPNNALPIIVQASNFVTDSNGGDGAVYEFVNFVLGQRK
jgi:3-deoxy-D-manno-octulosonate 8-phosphate phosphatase (KDO 8-P phosphatase)